MTEEPEMPPVLLKPMSLEKAAVESLQVLMRIEWRLQRVERALGLSSEAEESALRALEEYVLENES
jgi:hypothetical protein